MGTRSLTYFYQYGEKEPFFCFYRQYDGYPTGYGKELSEFLAPFTLVNGYQMNMKGGKFANGMGCLAAQAVTHFKEDIGGIYIHSPKLGQDSGQEYEYHIHAWQDDQNDYLTKQPFHTLVEVYQSYQDEKIFSGDWQQFLKWAAAPPQTDEGYIPVIHTATATKPTDLRTALRQGIVRVVFEKSDGSERRMRCTLNQELIPEDRLPTGTQEVLRKDPNLFKVWDVEKQDWRSFRKDRLINWAV
jgi:hypothetical protein